MSGAVIQFFRFKQFSSLLTGGVALCLFNISINFVNPVSPPHAGVFLGNEIESFVEFLMEELGSYEDFLKEYDENESESALQKAMGFFVGVLHSAPNFSYTFFHPLPAMPGRYILFSYSAFLTISTPPPKVV